MKLSTRLTIAMVALVLVTIAVTGALTYRNLLSIAVPRSLQRLGGHVQLLATELEAVVRGARADVLGFAVDEMVGAGSGDITDRSSIFAAAERRRLASRFSAELTAKPWYDDLRLIGTGDDGREIVRDSSALAALGAVLVALILAVFIARSMTQPLGQMTRAVETFTGDRPVVVPTEAGGEIGVLAKAFARMDAEVREKTAALTREIEERSRLFDLSPDLILTTDHAGNILRVSPSCEPIAGYSPKELVGRNGAEFVYSDDLEAARAEIRIARRGQQRRNFETRWVHRDGRLVPLAWSCVWSDSEQCHFLIGRDMTESKKAEEALIDSERMARSIIDTALDAIIQVNEWGEVLDRG